MPILLASANYKSPLFWAIIVGWIISVVLHEFAHGFVAHLGGDYTVRERGGLTLNPLQYVDPLMTFLLPFLFVLMGGIPLVGASTYIRVDLLRSRAWRSAMSLAGPFTNLIVFFICVIPLHPRFGWIDPYASPESWSTPQMFCGAMAALQLLAVQINLIPLPPLDGFNAIQSFLPADLRQTLSLPQFRFGCLIALYYIISYTRVGEMLFQNIYHVLGWLHYDEKTQDFIRRSYNYALLGYSS
jgi:Zn-dependent protease